MALSLETPRPTRAPDRPPMAAPATAPSRPPSKAIDNGSKAINGPTPVAGDGQQVNLALLLTRQAVFAGRGDSLATILGQPPQRAVGVVLLEPVELIKHRGAFLLERWDRAHEVPQTFHVV